VDLGTGERKPQGISSRTKEENVAGGSHRGAKAIREYKPQGIILRGTLVPKGLNTA